MVGTGAVRCTGLAWAAFFLATTVAEGAWNQPVGGASPINQADNKDARDASLTSIGGVPYVAWQEIGGTHTEVRVSRLNQAGTNWQQIVGGASPINHGGAGSGNSFAPSLAGIGGVPYVAWTEEDNTGHFQIRVSRPDMAGTAWEEVVGGASPINQAGNQDSGAPSLTSFGGVPYVAWAESDGTNTEVRVSRLSAAGNDWEQPWSSVTATYGGINHSIIRNASEPSLAVIGGVLYVAWAEDDNVNDELRVSRLNTAGTDWQQVVGGASPINQASDQDARDPSLTAIGSVPYVAWAEDDNENDELRVSRLDAAGTDWQQVVGGASPINQASDQDARDPSLTAIGGVPYVAWAEGNSANDVRVSRLNQTGSAWEQVVGGANPIDQAHALAPSLTAIGGVPYLAWQENDSTNFEMRVGRLEPELTAPAALATDHSAVLLSQVSSFGVPYPVAFEYGAGGALGSRTAATTSTGGEPGPDTVFRVVDGLAAATDHSYRAIGFDGTYAIAPGATTQFTTAAVPATQTQTQTVEVPGPTVVQTQTNTVTRLLVAVVNPKLKGRSGKRVAIEYLSTATGSATLEVLKGRKRVARITGTAKVGRNKIAWNGKQGRKKAKPGKYTLQLAVTDGDGQTATDRGALTLKR